MLLGGVLVMWDRKVVEIKEAVGRFSVTCRFKNVVDQFEWAFNGVNWPNFDGGRRLL